MLDRIEIFAQSAVKFTREKIIYFDPFRIPADFNDADVIFLTHEHFDHYSPGDLVKVRKDSTLLVAPASMSVPEFDQVLAVEPGKNYAVAGLNFATVPAYNLSKDFHPRANNWVGYVLELDGTAYYIAGDTDATPEAGAVHCDVAFVPVGGTYTMDAPEAATLVNHLRPRFAVPTHYGSVVGSLADAEKFVGLLDAETTGKILLRP